MGKYFGRMKEKRRSGVSWLHPGVGVIPEAMPLKGASSGGAALRPVLGQRDGGGEVGAGGEGKGRRVATPRNVRHAGSQTQPLLRSGGAGGSRDRAAAAPAPSPEGSARGLAGRRGCGRGAPRAGGEARVGLGAARGGARPLPRPRSARSQGGG